MSSVNTVISHMSSDFSDYPDAAREKYEGTHMFVGVIVPIEHSRDLRLGTPVLLAFGNGGQS